MDLFQNSLQPINEPGVRVMDKIVNMKVNLV